MADSIRRLRAVLAADLVPRQGEATAEEHAARFRQEIAPLVEHHRGELLASDGKACLATFATPSDALACATEIQQEAVAPHHEVTGPARHEARIGIHLGEVQESEGRLLGPGVYVAEHLETLARVGGVCVSEDVQRAVAGRTPFSFRDLGEQAIEGMPKTVRAYGVVGLSGRAPSRRPMIYAAAGALALLLAGVAAWWGLSARDGLPDSIVVLPFDDLSPNRDQEYFAHGISDELVIELARIDDLDVKGRMTGAAIKKAGLDTPAIAEKIGVNGVIDGSVRKDGSRLRISVQIISAPDGKNVWSESYDRPLADIFALQHEIATAVAAALRSDGPDAARPPTDSVDAYELYIQGERQRINFGREDLDQAARKLRLALQKDPSFALAHASLGAVHRMRCELGYAPCDVQLPLAEASVERALASDPDLARGWITHASLLGKKFEWEEAETAARRAVELDPTDASPRLILGQLLLARGQLDEGFASYERAVELDPLNSVLLTVVANSYSSVRNDHDRSAELFARAEVVDPEPPLLRSFLYLLALVRGERQAEALALLEGLQLPESAKESLARAMQSGDPAPLSRALLAVLVGGNAEPCSPSKTIGAALLAEAGEVDDAIHCLEKAVDEGSFISATSLYAKTWDSLRDDPRFEAVRRKMNLRDGGAP